IERVEVINEKDLVSGAGVLGEHAGEEALMFLIERRAERARQFRLHMEVKLVGLRCVGVFELRAETLGQFVEEGAQGGEQVHGTPRIMLAACSISWRSESGTQSENTSSATSGRLMAAT